MRWFVVGAAILASLLLACGGGRNDDETIRTVVQGFFRALDEDPPNAYTYLSQDCKDDISFLDFAASASFLTGFLGEAEMELRNIDISKSSSDEIEAEFEVFLISDGEEIPLTTAEDEEQTRFVKEDGRWRFADCATFGGQDEFGEDQPLPVIPEETGLTAAQRAEADDSPALPGEFVDLVAMYGGPYGNRNGPHTASHVNANVDYEHDQGLPPAGGPHWGSAGLCPLDPGDAPPYCGPVPWGFHRDAFPAESLVHNMEHSGVVLWYNTADDSIISDLADFARDNAGLYLVVAPFPEMEPETIAITGWSRRLTVPVDDYDRDELQEFLDVHECRFDPEGFC